MISVVIERMDGSTPLIIERAELLAEGFFRLDPSSRAGGIDALVGSTPSNEIVWADLQIINRTFVARSSPEHWKDLFTAGALPWLEVVDPSWDLIALDDEDWVRLDCRELLGDALSKLLAPYRAQAVATKMLHLKRWRLVPVVDRLVAQQLGAPSTADTLQIIDHVRAQGRANTQALEAIQMHLAQRGLERSFVRILDGLLWTSHPASLTHPLIGLLGDWTKTASS